MLKYVISGNVYRLNTYATKYTATALLPEYQLSSHLQVQNIEDSFSSISSPPGMNF
jgi:hypothetical protein